MSLETSLKALATRAGQEIKTVRSTDLGGLKLVKLTQAQYDAVTKDPGTVYFIVG